MQNEYFKTSVLSEPDLDKRIKNLEKTFKELYKAPPELIVRAPGRAEIVGNHTDYNNGFTLSACISKSMLLFFRKRKDKLIRVFSNKFPTPQPLVFKVSTRAKKRSNCYSNYLKGVIKELISLGIQVSGTDILIGSNIPLGSGVSSSAALEVSTALGFLHLSSQKIDSLTVAALCQRAENTFVGSPCGFLDQGTIVFGKKERLIFMDYMPRDKYPVSRINLIPTVFAKHQASFIVVVDKESKRQLGSSGYPARRKMCEGSLPFWSTKLEKKIRSLREIDAKIFTRYKGELKKINTTMCKRVEHIVYENQRVLNSVKALKRGNIKHFGKLLTSSGGSALRLYELDEKTPELTFLYNQGKKINGVLGIRNMGGGFAATTLALVEDSEFENFKKKLDQLYKRRFNKDLDFIKFKVTEGAGIIKSTLPLRKKIKKTIKV